MAHDPFSDPRDSIGRLRATCRTPAPTPRILFVAYDVTGFTDEEIDALAFEAVVQGEASDNEPGHPDVHGTTHLTVDADFDGGDRAQGIIEVGAGL